MKLQLLSKRPLNGERACISGSEYIFLEILDWRPKNLLELTLTFCDSTAGIGASFRTLGQQMEGMIDLEVDIVI